VVIPRNEVKWDMYYVYILESVKTKKYYIVTTDNLKRRINEHNSGNSDFTSWSGPYKLVWFSAFQNKTKAYSFEKYLKSSSGFAFRNKRLV
jgi:putative endonuclease